MEAISQWVGYISDRKMFGEMLFDLPEKHTIYQNNEL
jgi:hypothetical protein